MPKDVARFSAAASAKTPVEHFASGAARIAAELRYELLCGFVDREIYRAGKRSIRHRTNAAQRLLFETMPLTEIDQKHLQAADGWLELSDPTSAARELEHIEPAHRAHPDVLRIRYRIYVKAERWEHAFELAEGLTRLLPDDAMMFIWRSECARRMPGGGAAKALELLLDVVNDFPDEPAVPFNLACYNSVLGKFAEAQSWLNIAFEAAVQSGTARHWKSQAMKESDLDPLRTRP